MKFTRLPLLLIIIAASAAFAFGQKTKTPPPTCPNLKAPEFRGFYLGMTALEVRSKLEDTTLFDINAPKGPTGSHAVRVSAAELKEELAEGIDELNLAFVDGKLAAIKVTYTDAVTWDNGQDFINQTLASLGLPKPTAAPQGKGNEKYRVECKGFAVTLSYSFGVSPSFTINDTVAQKLADQRLENEGEIKTITVTPGTTTIPGRPK
ncbi:MAG: hypothetical protein JO360_18470 [Acidobacteria bacterium]|nr:hypothetical protein [Acidobacteriota bacterium]